MKELFTGLARLTALLSQLAAQINEVMEEAAPQNLLPILADMPEAEKIRLLQYYEEREAYHHCALIQRSIDAHKTGCPN